LKKNDLQKFPCSSKHSLFLKKTKLEKEHLKNFICDKKRKERDRFFGEK